MNTKTKEHVPATSEPPLAIVTVTYSPGRHIRELLDSIPGATHRPTLTVMADNGSTDGSVQAAVAPGVVLHETGGNMGYGTAINSAARMLRRLRDRGEIDPEFFVIVNPDVVFAPGSIDELIAAARRHPRAGAVGPKIVQEDGSAYPSARETPRLSTGIGHAVLGQVWPSNPWTAAYKQGSRLDSERQAGWVSGSCLLVRWDAFDSIGGFDEAYFMYMEDVDFGDRLGKAGWLNVFTPAAEIAHDQGHSANEHRGPMVAAHHESAYRYQAERHPGIVGLPIRVVLWLGLKVRARVFAALDAKP